MQKRTFGRMGGIIDLFGLANQGVVSIIQQRTNNGNNVDDNVVFEDIGMLPKKFQPQPPKSKPIPSRR